MKKLVLGTAIAALAATGGAYAEDYQFEIGALYGTGDKGGPDIDGFGFYGEFHFDVVDTSKGPLNEAAFLDKSSSVRAEWATAEEDTPGAESVDGFVVSGRFVTATNWIIEADYADFDGDDFSIGLGVGMYLNDTTDLVVTYNTYDEADKSSLSLDVHSVVSLTGDTAFAYDLGVSYLDQADESGYGLNAGADYYFNKAVSIGAAVALTSVDEVDTSTITVGVDYFVAPSIKLSADFASMGQDSDGDMLTLAAAVRF